MNSQQQSRGHSHLLSKTRFCLEFCFLLFLFLSLAADNTTNSNTMLKLFGLPLIKSYSYFCTHTYALVNISSIWQILKFFLVSYTSASNSLLVKILLISFCLLCTKGKTKKNIKHRKLNNNEEVMCVSVRYCSSNYLYLYLPSCSYFILWPLLVQTIQEYSTTKYSAR